MPAASSTPNTPRPSQTPPPGYEWVWDHGWVTRPIGSEANYQPTPGANLYTNTSPYYADGSPNTYENYMERRRRENAREMWTKAILPTLGFAVGGAALGQLGGGAGAAGSGAGVGASTGAGVGAGAAGAGVGATGAGVGASGATGAGFLGANTTAGLSGSFAPVAAGGGAAGTGAGFLGANTMAGLSGSFAPGAVGSGAVGSGAAGSGSVLGRVFSNPNTYRQLGSAFSNAAEEQAGERDAENSYANSTNRATADMYRTSQDAMLSALGMNERGAMDRAGLDLQRRNFALQAPSVRGRRGLAADLLANFQPATMQGLPSRVSSRMPTITPTGLSGQGQLLARLLRDQAIQETQRGDRFEPVPSTDFRTGILPQPQLQGYRGPGRGESVLGYLGLGANLAGAYMGGRG
jgi:hypothetical protein